VHASVLSTAHRSVSRAAGADHSNIESHRSKKIRRVVCSVDFFGSLQTFFALSQLRNASVMFGD
jgi:hypothetical protein